jgi:dephospho-CoA kinase
LLFVGLTGGLGSGKSEALAAAERLGAATLSSDMVVHDLLGTDEVREILRERWGERVVFSDPAELSWLEGALFPLVGRRIGEWRTGLEENGEVDVAIVEVPLLFEAGIESLFDATVAVVADEGLRADRAAARGHENVAGREDRQLTQDEKAARADHVVRNDGSLDDLEVAMAGVLNEIRSAAAT